MECTRAQALWLLQRDLAALSGQTAAFPKGATVYFLAQAWIQRFQQCVWDAVLQQQAVDCSRCALDNSSLVSARPDQWENLSVLVSQSEFEHIFRCFVTSQDQVLRGWVFWTPALETRLLTQLVVSCTVQQAAEVSICHVKLTESVPLSALLEKLQVQLQVQLDRATVWSAYLQDKEQVIKKVKAGTSLRTFARRLKANSLDIPILQVLQSLNVIVQVKKKSLLEWLAPHRKDKEVSTGLRNLGNTCFLNCAIQALAHVPQLTYHYHHVRPLTPLPAAFAELVRSMFSKPRGALKPEAVYNALGRKYSDGAQNDADEVMLDLLQLLSEGAELPLAVPVPLCAADTAWLQHLARSYSLPTLLFSGFQAHETICDQCGHRQTQYSVFTSLPLPIPSREPFLICVVPSDPAQPQFSFLLQVQAPLEHDLRISALRKAISARTNLRKFLLGAYSGRFQEADPKSTAAQVRYRVLEMPSRYIALLLEVELRGQLLETRLLQCHASTRMGDLKNQVLDVLDMQIRASQERQGILQMLQAKRVTEGERATMERCEVFVVQSSGQLLSLVQAQVQARTVEEWLALDEGLRLRCRFEFLPVVLQEALSDFPLNSSLSDSTKERVVVTLLQTLEFTFSERRLSDKLHCSACQQLTAHSCRQFVERFPQVAIFHLLRVQVQAHKLQKCMTEVCYPELGLDLRSLEQGPVLSPALYDLIAVISHEGDAIGGHYLAYVRNPLTAGWFRCNDSKCQRVEVNQALGGADLLIYHRR